MNHEKLIDSLFMSRSIRLASFSSSAIRNGAFVGAVIVANGKVIGEGAYKFDGGPHAEVNAFNSVSKADRSLIKGSTIYVSLEPCSIFGRTPPCADLLIREKFGRVVVGCIDFTPGVCGNGLQRLRQAGIRVEIGILQDEASQMSRFRQAIVRNQRPYVTLKQAVSTDGYVGVNGKQVSLTGKLANTISHQWRADHQAILIGINTLITDNPKLDVRHINGPSPIRIVLNPSGRDLNANQHLFTNQKATSTPHTFIAIDSTAYAKTSIPAGTGILKLDESRRLESLLEALLDLNVGKLLVEGGPATLNHFVNAGLWDEYRQWTSPLSLKPAKNGINAAKIAGRLKNRFQVGPDQLRVYMRVS